MKKMELFNVRATARQIRRREVALKTSTVVASIAMTLLLVFYGLIHFANSIGNFTVKLAEHSEIYGLALSETRDFEEVTTLLQVKALHEMDNITESWIDSNVDEIDGPHNGVEYDYIAYTFYLKNTGTEKIKYNVNIEVLSAYKGADEAVRVKVYKNGVSEVYAKNQKGTNTPEPNTISFLSEEMVMSQDYDNFLPGDIDKYTIVIWLEGNDPECLDNIKGGQVRFLMNFEIIMN